MVLAIQGPKAKAKAKSVPQHKGPPLSDIALAGKTVVEKVALARLALIVDLTICVGQCKLRNILHFIDFVLYSGQEAKKELSQLGSLKLDMPDGNARFKDGLSTIEKHVSRLTGFFSRCGKCLQLHTKVSSILSFPQLSPSCTYTFL